MTTNPTVSSLKNAQRMIKMLDAERGYLAEVRDLYGDHAPEAVELHREGWQISSAVLTSWERVGRQVLAIHPGLVESIRFSGSSKIVPEVFRTLPYINPLVVFPEPPELFSHTEGERMRLLGFLCYAKAKTSPVREWITTTHDPQAHSIGADLVIEISSDEGSVLECDYISFPLDGDPFTLAEAVEGVLARFAWNHGGQDDRIKNRFMRDVVKLTIGSIMYLCSTTLEAARVPRKSVQKSLNPPPRKPFSFYRVGWEIGAALSRSRAAIEVEDPSRQRKPGYEQDPQHRKAHFKTVWTGPGSMTPKTAFVAPYWTHLEKLGVSGVNTVRKVSIDRGA